MNPEELLRELLKEFFYLDKGDLLFSYKEDVSIGDIDKELQDKLKEYLD